MKYFKRQFLFLYIWFALITYASLTPNKDIPDFHLFPHFDKLVHFLMYLGLSFLMMASLFSKEKSAKALYLSFLTSSLIGGLFELVQKYLTFDRSASWLDFIANILGSLLGVFLFKMIANSKICRLIFRNE